MAHHPSPEKRDAETDEDEQDENIDAAEERSRRAGEQPSREKNQIGDEEPEGDAMDFSRRWFTAQPPEDAGLEIAKSPHCCVEFS